MKRPTITEENINKALELFKKELFRRLEQKGYGSFASTHEIMGIIDEEVIEMKDAVRENGKMDLQIIFENELLDIAVGCIFGVACVEQGTLDNL